MASMVASPHPFAALNLISDPIHGYLELTKRLDRDESAAAGLPEEDVAEQDLLDSTWLKRLRHEDLSQLIVERELADVICGLRRAPGAVAERDALDDREQVEPRWVSFLISKPALADPTMPRWVRWLQPLLSGVFTVDNLDYVRRDAHMTGVATDVDVERLRRYAFIGPRGLTLYEPGLGSLEQFLNARLFMYQQVYFHRTVR